MKIELKNVKHAAFASEETACFQATVYVDGVKAGIAHNDGRGGMTSVEPRELEARIDAYAKTLPEVKTDWTLEGKGFSYPQSAETIIDGLLDDWLQERDFNRLMKRVVIRLPDDKPGQFRVIGSAALKPDERTLASIAKQYPQAVILNAMPRADAFKLYRGTP